MKVDNLALKEDVRAPAASRASSARRAPADEALAAKGDYPFTWHPAKIHDEAFQAALNLQRGREMEESTRLAEARSIEVMCFMCAEDWLRDYRIRGGGSFITKGERERQLKRWTQWNIDKQAVKKIDPEVMSKLSIEHAGGEDWVQWRQSVDNARMPALPMRSHAHEWM
eukprot:280227-Amphidinium_carterae.1